jgi:hypothetical protein
MIIKIMMDRVPSNHNEKLMSFLMKNVNEYRNNLRMSIITIQNKHHKSLDAKITALPAAYIGINIVIGYKQIMSSITAAFNQSNANADADPVQSFWDKSIKNGLGDVKRKPTDDDALSSRFTEATKKRTNAYAGRSSKFKNGPRPESVHNAGDSNDEHDQRVNTSQQRSHSAPTSTAEMIMQQHSPTTLKGVDVDDPALLETDPYMKMFWANQAQTPGT